MNLGRLRKGHAWKNVWVKVIAYIQGKCHGVTSLKDVVMWDRDSFSVLIKEDALVQVEH